MVSWGQNTTHIFSTNASGSAAASPGPAAGGFSFGAPAPFGSPAPASGGMFGTGGASTSTTFGSPAPGGGGLFGAPAPGTAVFGAPASGGGLFGTSTTSTGGGLFGAPAPAQPFGGAPQGPQIAAQAAYQAHQSVQARQVEAEFVENLQRLNSYYKGTAMAPSPMESAPFTTISYNPASTEYQQRVWLVQGNTGNAAAKPIPDRPGPISVKDWELASLRAPEGYEPAALVGAAALQARLSAQQQHADSALDEIKKLRQFQKTLEERKQIASRQGLSVMKERLHKERKQRLWQIIQKVEMIRAYQQPLTKDERLSMEQTVQLHRTTETLASRPVSNRVSTGLPRLVTPDGKEHVDPALVYKALEEHRMELFQIMDAVKKDLRDVKLIAERLKK